MYDVIFHSMHIANPDGEINDKWINLAHILSLLKRTMLDHVSLGSWKIRIALETFYRTWAFNWYLEWQASDNVTKIACGYDKYCYSLEDIHGSLLFAFQCTSGFLPLFCLGYCTILSTAGLRIYEGVLAPPLWWVHYERLHRVFIDPRNQGSIWVWAQPMRDDVTM